MNHHKRFDENKKTLKRSNLIYYSRPKSTFYAMCDASNFEISAALLQTHQGNEQLKLVSANSRLFTKAELRHFTPMREWTAVQQNIYPNHNTQQF